MTAKMLNATVKRRSGGGATETTAHNIRAAKNMTYDARTLHTLNNTHEKNTEHKEDTKPKLPYSWQLEQQHREQEDMQRPASFVQPSCANHPNPPNSYHPKVGSMFPFDHITCSHPCYIIRISIPAHALNPTLTRRFSQQTSLSTLPS
jgi:hypothetical protein